ncbi:MAG: sensor domain-containing diguanylate cyclase [Planctomycetota bacterium]|jgi:diguanylate cyclase (GGDEF)-like protein
MAVRDLRRRVVTAFEAAGPARPPVSELLALDPLTILRCLRMVYAPVVAPAEEVLTIQHLMSTLGKTVVQRAFQTPVLSGAGTNRVRKLWLHSLATAHAAHSLAEASDLLDPDEAYFLGLLHDIPLWQPFLQPEGENTDKPQDYQAWMRSWNLPQTLQDVVLHTNREAQHEPVTSASMDSRESLICAAGLLAELADYWHPGEGDQKSRELLLSLVTKEDFVAAQNLRHTLAATLARFGLVATSQVQEGVAREPQESLRLFPGKHSGSLAEVVSSMLHCSTSTDYRGIMTATTAAALRYLDFERVFIVHWSRRNGRCWIRAKADLSIRPLKPVMVPPNDNEVAALENALTLEKARKLVRPGTDQTGLLGLLGVDEVLLVPVNARFQTQSFLLLDRTLSNRAIREDQDAPHAEALAGTAAIINENLLLRNQSERDKVFALTDPLTRLYNRGVGIGTLEREIARARRQRTPLTVLMMDLDDFKQLNDQHGHLAGDQALRITAEVLRKTLRKTDTVCRYGGEEFLMVLPDTTIEQASVLATRIFTAVEAAGKKHELPLTGSIGLTEIHYVKDSLTTVLARADRALYASKSRGRNRFSVDGA